MAASVSALTAVRRSGLGLAELDRALMAEIGAEVGDLLLVDNGSGAPIAVRVAAPHDDHGVIRLDRYVRRAARVGVGYRVELTKPEMREADLIVVRPLGQLSVDMTSEAHVHRMLHDAGVPVSVGAILHVRFRQDASAGMPYVVRHVAPGPGWVGESTRIRVEQRDAGWVDPEVVGFEDVGGLGPQIELLRELVQLPLQRPEVYRELGITPPRGLILHGPPGTGKTRLIHALAGDIRASYFYVSGPEIVGQTYGEAEARLRSVFDDAVRACPSIVFIDELDALAPQRGASGSHSDARLVGQLLALLDGLREAEGLMVVATTNRLGVIDRACRRAGRFDREVFIGPPSVRGRREILDIHTREMPLSTRARASLEDVARRAVGYVGSDLMDLCREAALVALRRRLAADGADSSAPGVAVTIDAEDFEAALKAVRPAVRRIAAMRVGTRWDELARVGGLEDTVLAFVQARLGGEGVPLRRDGMLPFDKGICLHGESGIGKTALAEAVADRCGVPLFAVQGGEVFSKWLGDSEATIRDLFETASQFAPAVVLLDQLDIIASRDAHVSGPVGAARVLTQVEAELDRLHGRVAVIATVNDLASVHASVLRKGRLGTHIRLG